MSKNLVIVESPAKAKTLKKFLGSSYKIEASVGHVRDLPKSELGIDVENDFEPKYITIRGKGEVLSKLRREARNADKVYLATDPDREGEAISWHLSNALKLDADKAIRITFNEITKTAVKKSIKEARSIDMNLVDAQQARRELDRIVGYKLSPLLWKKVRRRLSAGRVQSVALKMICDREEEINAFTPREYWTIDVTLSSAGPKSARSRFSAKFVGSERRGAELDDKRQSDEVVAALDGKDLVVAEVKSGARVRKPAAPFTTSTLQQEASKHLNFATNKTMMVAQQLYEGVDIEGEGAVGIVTYIRTDSTRISDEAFEDVRAYILEKHGERYASPEKTEYKNKGRAQDAHEAIRPTYVTRTPDSVKASLTKDQFKLYKLIWERFVACQMTPATYRTRSVKLVCAVKDEELCFRASGSVLDFDGFLSVYSRPEDPEDAEKNPDQEADNGARIPDLKKGDAVKLQEIKPAQHFTQPPARYTEAMLVRTMEELGIGRPSTYAATIANIVARRYVLKENKMFFPTELGLTINEIMKNNFEDIVDIDFTAKMEEDLDKVEDGRLEWKEIVRVFYGPFDRQIKLAEEKIGDVEIGDEETDIICENCGRRMVIKYGRFGRFLACPGFPECKNAKPYFEEAGVNCPECGGRLLIKKTKKGRKYYGCENNPECPFMSWNKPTGEKCPVCGEPLVEKGSRDSKKIACSNDKCGYVAEAALSESDRGS